MHGKINWMVVALVEFVLFLCCAGVGLRYAKQESAESEVVIQQLKERNTELTTRIADLVSQSESNAGTSQRLTEGLTSLVGAINQQLELCSRITERAERIDALAGAIDTAIDGIIACCELLEDDYNNRVRDSRVGSPLTVPLSTLPP